MRYLKPFILVIIFSLLWSCNNDNSNSTNEQSSIEIGNYIFNFETEFTLEELQGIDSYIGNVNGSGISLTFDYGWYTSPATNLPIDEYIITEDEIDGHYRQVVKPIDSEVNFTRLHVFKISDSIESPYGYNSLSILTNNLSAAQQEMIIDVFNNVDIIE